MAILSSVILIMMCVKAAERIGWFIGKTLPSTYLSLCSKGTLSRFFTHTLDFAVVLLVCHFTCRQPNATTASSLKFVCASEVTAAYMALYKSCYCHLCVLFNYYYFYYY